MKWLIILYLIVGISPARGQSHEEQAVAAVLMDEAWSEGIPGMTAVAEVIHQRAVEKSRTPLQVVTARGRHIHAFCCLDGATLDQLIQKFTPLPDYQKALQIAQTVCQSPDQLPGLARHANHFTSVTERPYWARGHRPVCVIGRHAFYRLEKY